MPAIGVVFPLIALVFYGLNTPSELWDHLVTFVLKDVVFNTIIFGVGVVGLTAIIGISLAALVSFFEFPGRRFFEWALLAPMAIPGYVLGFVWIGTFDFSGPFQTWLRNEMNFDGGIPPIRSVGGLILIMSLALYPYVYLLAKEGFNSMGQSILEVSRSLGYTRFKAFFKAVLPATRPWLLGGLSLVLMETLADFGTCSVFNYDTFATSIYKTWFDLHSVEGASQLSLIHIFLVLMLVVLINKRKEGSAFEEKYGGIKKRQAIGLSPMAQNLTFLIVAGFFALTFLFPIFQLGNWFLSGDGAPAPLVRGFKNSMVVAGISGFIVCGLGLTLGYCRRHFGQQPLIRISSQLVNFGYSVPGTVFALALMVSLTYLLGPLNRSFYLAFGVLILGMSLRFMAVSFHPLDSGFCRLPTSLNEVSRSLGVFGPRLLGKVYLPVLKKPILSTFVLVFIDVVKEMPMSVMLRPFGGETLSAVVYQFTSEGQWQEASGPALIMVFLALGPIFWMALHRERVPGG